MLFFSGKTCGRNVTATSKTCAKPSNNGWTGDAASFVFLFFVPFYPQTKKRQMCSKGTKKTGKKHICGRLGISFLEIKNMPHFTEIQAHNACSPPMPLANIFHVGTFEVLCGVTFEGTISPTPCPDPQCSLHDLAQSATIQPRL